MTEIQSDIQRLIDHCHSMAEKLLIKQEEFYPFAAYLKNSDELVAAGLYDSDEFPLSRTLIDNFKNHFNLQIKDAEIKAYAIAFDTKITSKDFPESVDAIAIRIVHISSENIVVYYFPYKLFENQIKFFEGWGEYSN
jgi:hypothetical protein